MFTIRKARRINEANYLLEVAAPLIAKRCLPGQFVVVKIDEVGERIPLTICDYDRESGMITLVFQPVGLTTNRMKALKAGDSLMDVVGPLGRPSELTEERAEDLKKRHILFVAGGVGAAPVYPQVKWLNARGVKADVIIGAKTENLVLLEKETREVAGKVYVTTDDGSYASKGLVTDMITELVEEKGEKYDHCVAIGPMIMMKFVVETTKKYGIPTTVSMNPIMVDGTGMCGACRVTVNGETKFACVDGPEFDGFGLDFNEAMKRARMYKTEEGRAMLKWLEGATHTGGCGNCDEGAE